MSSKSLVNRMSMPAFRFSLAKMPAQPAEFGEKPPASALSKLGAAMPAIGIAVGAIGGFILAMRDGVNHSTGFLAPVFGFMGDLLVAAIGGVAGLVAGLILWGVLALLSDLPAVRAKRMGAWESRKAASEQARAQWFRLSGEQNDVRMRWRAEMTKYEDEKAAYDRAWGDRESRTRGDYDRALALRDRNIRESAGRALDLVPAPTAWASRDPVAPSRELAIIISQVLKYRQVPNPLPDPGLPPFAPIDSLPETAPHMRAELAAMRGEFPQLIGQEDEF